MKFKVWGGERSRQLLLLCLKLKERAFFFFFFFFSTAMEIFNIRLFSSSPKKRSQALGCKVK